MISSESIEEFVTEASASIEAAPQMNEAMTRKAVLDQFCDLLNWDFPRVAKVEYPVEAFGRQHRVDYAYVDDGSEKAFLEAKGVDTPLTDDAREQLKAYLRNGAAELGILANGRKYEFYRRVTAPTLTVKRVIALQLEELIDHPRILNEFTHESLSDGNHGVMSMLQERELRDILQTEKTDIAADIERTIIDQTQSKVSGGEFRSSIRSHINTATKSAVDTLVSELDPQSNEPDADSNNSDKPDPHSNEKQDYIVQLQFEGKTLNTFSDNIQADAMAKAVSYLVSDHELIAEIEPLPYIPGRKKAIINDSPTSPHDEEAMRIYRELSGGYYLDTHMSASRKQRCLEKFAVKCQLEVTFEGEW